MYISTSDIKYRLKEKIQRYLNEDGPRRQGIAQETQSFRRPLAKSVEKQVSGDGGGIGSTIAQYAPMVAMMAAPSIIGAVKTKLTQKVAANALKTAVVGAPIIIKEDGPRRQGVAQETQSFRRPLAQSVSRGGSASDGGGGMGAVGTIANQAPTAIMLAQMARKKAAEKVVEQGTKEVVKRGGIQAVKRVGGEAFKRVGGEAVKRVGVEVIKQGVRTAATTALQGVGASSAAAVAGTAVAGLAIGTAAAYGVNKGIDSYMGYRPGDGLAARMGEWDTINPISIAQGIGSLGRSDEMIQRETKIEADSAKADFEADGRGQNLRAGKAEEKAAGDKFDREYLAKAGNTKEGLEAIKNGTPNPVSGSANGSVEREQEQNQTLKITAGSGNTRVQGGSITFTSKQDQSMKGIDPRSPGYDEQNREVSIEVRNAAVPRVEGSNPDSALNRKMQELATRRQGYIKLGDVNITDSQRQGTGPSADTLTGAAQGSRGTATPTAAPTGTPLDPTVIRMKKERDLLAAQGKTKGVIINGVVQSDSGPSADTLTGAVRAKADQMNTERVKRVKEREAKEQGTTAPTATPTATQSNKPLKPLSYNSVIDENGNDKRTGKPASDFTREIDDDKKDMINKANQVRDTGKTTGTFVGGKLQDGGATTTGQDGSTRTTRTTQNGNETREEEISQYDAANDPSKKAARKVMGLE